MSAPGVGSDLLRLRLFRDPEGSFLNVPRAEVEKRYPSSELDLEDELLDAATQTWAPMWKAQRGALPEGWSPLVSQRKPEFRELKAMVRRGELTYSVYVQRRDQLRHQVIAGAAPTAVQDGASRGVPRGAKDLLEHRLRDKFKRGRELGEGGGGIVSLLTNTHTGAQVAVKIATPQFKNHIRNELKQLEAVRSPGAVHVRDRGPIDEHGERWYRELGQRVTQGHFPSITGGDCCVQIVAEQATRSTPPGRSGVPKIYLGGTMFNRVTGARRREGPPGHLTPHQPDPPVVAEVPPSVDQVPLWRDRHPGARQLAACCKG